MCRIAKSEQELEEGRLYMIRIPDKETGNIIRQFI
jgi:hypothetical protein